MTTNPRELTDAVAEPPGEVAQTHIATVFLAGDRAYKLKKPVDLGFVDFRSRSDRLLACRREVELNSRFAPDVYLGVADVFLGGAPCDHLVVMRRMPAGRRLSTLVRAGVPLTDEITGLARMMAACHGKAQRSDAISAEGTRDAIAARWEDSFATVDAIAGVAEPLLAEVRELTREFLAGREDLFARRVAQGRIVDGHGDLLADDIYCLDDGPRVLDCLEFDDRLRWLDGLDDISFLAMDLEQLGAPGLCALLVARYLEFSGDHAPVSLREHYLAYRAFVRTKVACLRHDQDRSAAAARSARRYAEVAAEHLRRGRVQLTVVGGLPGTGKTTVAGRIADQQGAVLLSSDRVRKELAGLSPAERHAAAYREGIYTQHHTERVYAELLARARKLLSLGESVVLDASWSTAGHRERAKAMAVATHSGWRAVRCTAPAKVVVGRLNSRAGSLSDADVSIMSAMAAATDPWPEAITVPTTDTVDRAVAIALSGP